MTVTKEQARDAVDRLDDYARLAGVIPIGQVSLLRQFIEQSAAQPAPAGMVLVPRARLTTDEIIALRRQAKDDPRCQEEHWFVLMARAVEDRYLTAAPTAQPEEAARQHTKEPKA